MLRHSFDGIARAANPRLWPDSSYPLLAGPFGRLGAVGAPARVRRPERPCSASRCSRAFPEFRLRPKPRIRFLSAKELLLLLLLSLPSLPLCSLLLLLLLLLLLMHLWPRAVPGRGLSTHAVFQLLLSLVSL